MKTVRITIPFHDKPLVLIDHNEQPFVAMRPIVDGMGMAWPPQLQKLKKRFASTVTEIVTVADDGRKRAMLCLPLDTTPRPAHNAPQQRKKRCSGLEACNQTASKAASVAVFLRPRFALSMGNRGGRLMPAGIVWPVFQPAFVSRPNVWKRSGEPEPRKRQGATMTSTPYIAIVAVPVAPTAQDIAADISPACWQPLGQFPDKASAQAAVQAFIATHDHDACFISANPAHPLYQRAMQRLGENAGGAA